MTANKQEAKVIAQFDYSVVLLAREIIRLNQMMADQGARRCGLTDDDRTDRDP